MITETEKLQEIDLSYYEAQPPQMVDAKEFPPLESLKGKYGRVELSLDHVIDPDYPWQILDHDSPGGQKRREEIKQQKAKIVQNYVVTHSRYWQQFRDPEYFPGDRTATYSYTVGHSRTQSTSVEAGLEVSLGLEKGIFSAGIKGSLEWSSRTEESFSESETRTIEQHYQGDCWYFYWQTMDELTVYRRTQANPDALEQVRRVVAPSGLVMTDRFQRPNAEAKPEMRLGAGMVELEKGQSHVFPGYVFANTKVSVKNLSNNDDGELTLSWLSLGGKVILDVGPGKVKSVKKYLPGDFKAINSGVTKLEVWNDT